MKNISFFRSKIKNLRGVFFSKKINLMLLLGFSSGLPLALSGGTLQAWLAISDIDIKTIGLIGLVGLPYTIKFLWAPILDRYSFKHFRRKGWILTTQLLIMINLIVMSFLDPQNNLLFLTNLALTLAFLSSTQDIAFDALRADLLTKKERGLGIATSVLGYRLAMIVSGALCLVIADFYGFKLAYCFMAIFMGFGAMATLIISEPPSHGSPLNLKEALILPFGEFFKRGKFTIVILLLIISYKLGDAFAGTLSTTFLLRVPEFSLTDIGLVNKTFAIFSSIFGAFLGGVLLNKLNIYRSLLFFGLLQAFTNLFFISLIIFGKNYILLVICIGLENIAGGMGTAAFIAFLMGLCNKKYSATQFALFSAMASVGRVFVSAPAGFIVSSAGWSWFFVFTFFISIPSLIILIFLKKKIENL